MDVEKKTELKSPKLHTSRKTSTCQAPLQKCRNLDTSNPNLTQPCGWGGGPGVVALATREQSAPIVPKAWLLRVELAHNLHSPGVPFHTQVREPPSAMRRQEQPPVQGFWSPCSAMEAMNQSGQPRKSKKRGSMQPARLTSRGLALEEITCRRPTPTVFLLDQASLPVR